MAMRALRLGLALGAGALSVTVGASRWREQHFVALAHEGGGGAPVAAKAARAAAENVPDADPASKLGFVITWSAHSIQGRRRHHEDRYLAAVPLLSSLAAFRSASSAKSSSLTGSTDDEHARTDSYGDEDARTVVGGMSLGVGGGSSAGSYQSLYDSVSLFAVFDGHSGHRAAEFAAAQFPDTLRERISSGLRVGKALEEAFFAVDEAFLSDAVKQRYLDGTTAVVAAICGNHLIVANAGDSRAVLGLASENGCDGANRIAAIPLSFDHKPENEEERERIEARGGWVLDVHGGRVNGGLNISRGLGDLRYKNPESRAKHLVICDPDITFTELDSQDRFMILASDGLWDVFSNEEAVTVVAQTPQRDAAARVLVEKAYEKGSSDNVSAVVVFFDAICPLSRHQKRGSGSGA